MKISASVYSNKEKKLIDLVKELDRIHVDFLHIDCNNDINVFNDIKDIREISNTPIDLHIISKTPEKFYPLIEKYNIELVTLQHEELNGNFTPPLHLNCLWGISIVNNTPVSVFEDYKGWCSFILLMTTTPGKSGGSFAEITYDRIQDFNDTFPSKAIHIDGGVNDEVASNLRKLGVNCCVSGSYLVKSNKLGEALLKLRSKLTNLNYSVKDFMLKPSQLPIIYDKELGFELILKVINKYKLGYLIVLDKENDLKGIITDGDIRDELLKHIDDLNNINVNNLINRNPKTIFDNQKISSAFDTIANHHRQIMFLPVINKKNKFKGIISITQLIKGNL